MNENTKTTCPYCGTWVDQTEEVCPQCLAPLKPTQKDKVPEVSQRVEGPAKPAKQQAKLLAPTAIASLVLGIWYLIHQLQFADHPRLHTVCHWKKEGERRLRCHCLQP